MNRLVRLTVVTGLVAWQTACCIPRERTALQRPALSIQVVDRHGGPVAGATVHVRRTDMANQPPLVLHASATTTDGEGRAQFERLEAQENYFPYMLHGLPNDAYEVCALAPGMGTAIVGVYAGPVGAPQEEPLQVSLVLDGESPGCAWSR